ncbi:hypothetical protein [Streptomyces sp. NPDC057582]|uniref:hypothetical protein n=1 Tax=Streptomyces sp. NPDC057582 TaxID=3346174 RepID=UPI00368316D5
MGSPEPASAVEQAVAARIAAAVARREQQRSDRAARARRRAYGLAQRHAAKLRRLDDRDRATGVADE